MQARSRKDRTWQAELRHRILGRRFEAHRKRCFWTFLIVILIGIEIFYSHGENLDFLLKSRLGSNPSLNDSVDSMYARLNQQLVTHRPNQVEDDGAGAIRTERKIMTPSAGRPLPAPSQPAIASGTPMAAEPPSRREKPSPTYSHTAEAAVRKETQNKPELHVKWEN